MNFLRLSFAEHGIILLPMEYRIVKTNGHVGVYQVTVDNGRMNRKSEPDLEAESIAELQKKIADINPAFWKPAFIEEK